MADDRTEKATPKRRAQARDRGQVARSMELNTGMGLLALFVLLSAFGGALFAGFAGIMSKGLANAGTTGRITPEAAWALMMDVGSTCMRLTAPFAIGGLVVGVLASAAQVRPGLRLSVLTPRFSALSPKTGVKRLFSLRSVVSLVKDLLKIGVVAAVTWWALRSEVDALVGLTGAEPETTIAVVAGIVMDIGFAVAAAYIVLAIADVFYERWQFERDLRMSKDEVKREFKDQDLSPEIKAQMKRRQREMAVRRMMSAVPQADVVITNPTHFAVALRYARALPAPQVVAKGADAVAHRIIATARENDVQVIQDPPLARSLYAAAEVGQFIPAEAFAAVAEILAAVYRLTGREPAAA
ncbi:MAG TPA: flagellar biosynthesis protein FlhB [Miltoncostaeaceae bacterium]|jgi:flagellar biosynthesis protein FlhB|nr:flagellar biosynthesis protein FlhB [Miltoncostaeaceae bacterium]